MTNQPTPTGPYQQRLEVVAMPNYKPIVTYVILGITVFVYLLQIGTFLLNIDIPGVLGAKINEAIIAGQYWRLFTPMLLHNIFPLHILFNMCFLAIIGSRLEKVTGHGSFLLLYIVAGFAGNVFSFLFTSGQSVGASTALFGAMGVQVIFIIRNRSFLVDEGRTALQNAIAMILINIAVGFTLGADNWGHIGGLVGGVIFGWFGGPIFDLEEISFPRFRLIDARSVREKLFGAALVLIIFGGFAFLKIAGIAF